MNASASRILVDVTSQPSSRLSSQPSSRLSSQLAAVAPAQRRFAAVLAGGFAVVLLIVGLVPWFGDAPVTLRVLAVAVLVVAAALALVSWGLMRGLALERAEASVDAAVEAGVRAAGQQMCDCGVAHDPDEMHITEPKIEGCAPTDASCTHSCATCVLSAQSR
jgi:hypothetical protein